MDRTTLDGMWNHFRTIHGITLRAIQAVPGDKIDSRPVRDMRTPRELIVHAYGTMRAIAEGATKGEVSWDEAKDEKAACEAIRSHADLVRYAEDCWKAADRAIGSLTPAQITGPVKTPWGFEPPGFICVTIIYDEHLHHRGQLYAYLRQMGVEPPFMWDFEHNAPEYQPKAAAQPA